MTNSRPVDPPEDELLSQVLRLFPKRRYERISQAALGRKRIDLLCIPRAKADSVDRIAVELKVSNWRRALWQAFLNLQVASESYIAIWHRYVHRAQVAEELLRRSGVGLIEVRPKSARILITSADPVYRIARHSKRDFYNAVSERV